MYTESTQMQCMLHINTLPRFKMSDDAGIWFLCTPVICMRLYLFYWRSE